MDPAWIAFILTFGGAGMLKTIESLLQRYKPASGQIVAGEVLKAVDSPLVINDWSNRDFIADVHERRMDELDEYGEFRTECFCSSHKKHFVETVPLLVDRHSGRTIDNVWIKTQRGYK